jgi:hypothetical protein
MLAMSGRIPNIRELNGRNGDMDPNIQELNGRKTVQIPNIREPDRTK